MVDIKDLTFTATPYMYLSLPPRPGNYGGLQVACGPVRANQHVTFSGSYSDLGNVTSDHSGRINPTPDYKMNCYPAHRNGIVQIEELVINEKPYLAIGIIYEGHESSVRPTEQHIFQCLQIPAPGSPGYEDYKKLTAKLATLNSELVAGHSPGQSLGSVAGRKMNQRIVVDLTKLDAPASQLLGLPEAFQKHPDFKHVHPNSLRGPETQVNPAELIASFSPELARVMGVTRASDRRLTQAKVSGKIRLAAEQHIVIVIEGDGIAAAVPHLGSTANMVGPTIEITLHDKDEFKAARDALKGQGLPAEQMERFDKAYSRFDNTGYILATKPAEVLPPPPVIYIKPPPRPVKPPPPPGLPPLPPDLPPRPRGSSGGR